VLLNPAVRATPRLFPNTLALLSHPLITCLLNATSVLSTSCSHAVLEPQVLVLPPAGRRSYVPLLHARSTFSCHFPHRTLTADVLLAPSSFFFLFALTLRRLYALKALRSIIPPSLSLPVALSRSSHRSCLASLSYHSHHSTVFMRLLTNVLTLCCSLPSVSW
jgi:hypothetical protein